MPRRRFIFDPPERFVAGTIGEPGDRTFFLQARDGVRVVSVALEKVQVSAPARTAGVGFTVQVPLDVAVAVRYPAL